MSSIFEKRATKSSSGSYPVSETVVIILKEIVAADPRVKGSASNVADDHFVGYLLHDAAGIVAEFDKDMNPITEVRVYQAPEKVDPNKKAGRARPSIFSKKTKNGLSPVSEVGSVMAIESCYLAKDKGPGPRAFVGTWLKALTSKPWDPETQFPARTWIRIHPENTKNAPDTWQYASLVAADSAVQVASVDDLDAALLDALSYAPDVLPGDAGFVVRVASLEQKAAFSVTQYATWLADEQRTMTSEDAIAKFKESEDGQAIIAHLTANPGDFAEVLSASRLKTGKQSLPTAKHADKAAANPGKTPADYDDASFGAIPREGSKWPVAGYFLADVLAWRRRAEAGEEVEGFSAWSRTYTRAVGGADNGIRNPDEFPSALLNEKLPELAALFQERGRDNKKAAFAARKAGQAPAGDHPAADQEVGGPAPR